MKQCSKCVHGGKEINFMHFCSCLGYSVVTNRSNSYRTERIGKKNTQVEMCRAEELGKGNFKLKI